MKNIDGNILNLMCDQDSYCDDETENPVHPTYPTLPHPTPRKYNAPLGLDIEKNHLFYFFYSRCF